MIQPATRLAASPSCWSPSRRTGRACRL